MKRSIKGILFDVDGTLLDTREFIYQAFEHTFRRYELPVISRKELSPLMGTLLEQVYEKVAPTVSASVLSATHREFQRHHPKLVKPFSGAVEILPKLHDLGLKIAAVTSRREHVSKGLEDFGILQHMDFVMTGNDVHYHKPHPEGVLRALQGLGVDVTEGMMVGDMPNDVAAGKAAEVATVGVTWGFMGEAIAQTHPDYVVDTAEELLEIVKKLI